MELEVLQHIIIRMVWRYGSQSHAMGAAIWVLTIPWLCTHIWEHYLYFQDERILTEHFEMIKEAFLFFEDYLFEVDGYLMTGPSVSPENKYRLKMVLKEMLVYHLQLIIKF